MRWVVCVSFVAVAGTAGAVTWAQSLGELAAREKARRDGAKSRAPQRVYTQEDLDKMEGARPPSSAAAAPAAPPPPPPSGGGGDEAQGPSGEGGSPLDGGGEGGREKSRTPEDEWRERHQQALGAVETARQNQGSAEAEVERLKQDLNPMSTTFTTDPYAILQLQAKLTEAQARAADAQKQVDAAQARADEVAREARSNGVYLR